MRTKQQLDKVKNMKKSAKELKKTAKRRKMNFDNDGVGDMMVPVKKEELNETLKELHQV